MIHTINQRIRKLPRWPQTANHCDTMRAWARQFVVEDFWWVVEDVYFRVSLGVYEKLNAGPMKYLTRYIGD